MTLEDHAEDCSLIESSTAHLLTVRPTSQLFRILLFISVLFVLTLPLFCKWYPRQDEGSVGSGNELPLYNVNGISESLESNVANIITLTNNNDTTLVNEANKGHTMHVVTWSTHSGSGSGLPTEREKKMSSTGMIASRELRGLLADVKTSGVHKWDHLANYPELRQLYIALDRVLTDLKAYKQHSFPFLKRVSKAEAYDYYDVIREPMDLSTMTKHLNAHKYFSKAEFQHDLNLIFSNCRTYNQDPASPYLVHAAELEKKSIELMRNVPDIDLTASRDVILEDINRRLLPSSKERKEHRLVHDTSTTRDSSTSTSTSMLSLSSSSPSPTNASSSSSQFSGNRALYSSSVEPETSESEQTRRWQFYTEDPTLTCLKHCTRRYRLEILVIFFSFLSFFSANLQIEFLLIEYHP